MRRLVWATMAIGVMVAAASGSVRADVVLSGPDSNDGTYSTAALSALATSGDTVNDSGSGLTGISVWGLLGGANASGPTSPVYGGITSTISRAARSCSVEGSAILASWR